MLYKWSWSSSYQRLLETPRGSVAQVCMVVSLLCRTAAQMPCLLYRKDRPCHSFQLNLEVLRAKVNPRTSLLCRVHRDVNAALTLTARTFIARASTP